MAQTEQRRKEYIKVYGPAWKHRNAEKVKRQAKEQYARIKARLATDDKFRSYCSRRSKAYKQAVKSDPEKHARILEIRRKRWHANKKPLTEARKEYLKSYARKRRANDPAFRIRGALTCRIRSALRGLSKSASTIQLTGCTLSEFIRHLESQWADGMSWENYGRGVGNWNVDHIKPCAAFDLTDPLNQQVCFHYSNLRPLWYSENQSKGSRWNGKIHRYAKKILS